MRDDTHPCRTSVTVCGEIATCVLSADHEGQHGLQWEGDPRHVVVVRILVARTSGPEELLERLLAVAAEVHEAIQALRGGRVLR